MKVSATHQKETTNIFTVGWIIHQKIKSVLHAGTENFHVMNWSVGVISLDTAKSFDDSHSFANSPKNYMLSILTSIGHGKNPNTSKLQFRRYLIPKFCTINRLPASTSTRRILTPSRKLNEISASSWRVFIVHLYGERTHGVFPSALADTLLVGELNEALLEDEEQSIQV